MDSCLLFRSLALVNNQILAFHFLECTMEQLKFGIALTENQTPEDDEKILSNDSDLPLAAKMRPRNFDEYVGQQHLLAPGKLLRRAIDRQRPIAAPPVRGPPRQCLRRGVGAATLKRCSATGVWPASATR